MAVHSHTWRDLDAFVPADVRQAIVRGGARPERCDGAVLVADVSGFTPLTEAFARRHGARRGGEEVAALLDSVYGKLVAEVDNAGGSVVEFAGDAVCCCFDGDDGAGALRCGLRMQEALAALRVGGVPAHVSVAIAAGPFTRVAVGDAAIRVFELVAGGALDRLGAITRHAGRGDVIADGATADRLGERIVLRGWRGVGEHRCAAIARVVGAPAPPAPAPPALSEDQAQAWVAASVLEWLRGGGDEPLVGELRSVVPLFVRFAGIDYDAPEARTRLDAYVRFVQATIDELGGTIFNIVVDEKGSYLCAGFGAPVAHDNDPQRAAAAALALRSPPPAAGGVTTAGIGLTRGHLYAGLYGGATRRTFGLQGTQANLAARLMQAADPQQILVERPLADVLRPDYELRKLAGQRVKGRDEPVALCELVGARRRGGAPSPAPGLVDRARERDHLDRLLSRLRDGRGGVVLLEGEPGIGKSRLVRHLADRAHERAVTIHAGAGDPIERGAPYHGWHPVFNSTLGAGSVVGDAQALRTRVLERLAAAGGGDAHGDPSGLSAEAHGEATHDLLADTLAATANAAPTLVVLEDAHWLDSASLALAKRIATDPGRLLLVLTTRPLAEHVPAELERLAVTPGCERMRLGPLQPADVRELAARSVGAALAPGVTALIESKAGGNPLFTRELALALRDRGLLSGRGAAAPDSGRFESPDSVEAVIASRIDRLPGAAQAVLKVGSVLGRSFDADALRELAGADAGAQLALLEQLELLGRDGAPSGGQLAFRHALIRDVVYGRLLFAQRRELHRRAAEYLERQPVPGHGATHAALAYHWEHAELPQRAAAHFAAGGEAAFRAGAFRECADMLGRALELSGDELERVRRARWQWHVAHSCHRLGDLERCHRLAAQAIAALDRPVPDGLARLVAASARELLRQVAYRALPRLARRPPIGQRETLRLATESQLMMAEVFYLSSDTPRSAYVALRSLNLAERLGPSRELAECYGAICIVAGLVGAHATAERYGVLARRAAEAIGDDPALALTLHQQCMYRSTKGPYTLFAADYQRSIQRLRDQGDKPRLRDALCICAIGDHLFGRPERAERGLRELLATVEPQERSINETWAHIWLGALCLRRGDPSAALERLRFAAARAPAGELDMTSLNIVALSALALRRCGRDAEARREEEAAWALLGRLGRRPSSHAVLDAYCALAELALTRWDEARGVRERLRARRRAFSASRNLRVFARIFAIGAPARWLYEGERLWRRGRPERALRAWERAGARAAALDMRHELALAHAVLGDRLPAGRADARRHAAAADELLRELGAPPETRAVTTPRPPAAGMGTARHRGSGS